MQKNLEPAAVDIEPILVTVRTACRLVGLGPTKLYELLKAGAIESTKIGGKRLLVYQSLKGLVTTGSSSTGKSNR